MAPPNIQGLGVTQEGAPTRWRATGHLTTGHPIDYPYRRGLLLGLLYLAMALLTACAMAPGHGFMNTNTPELAGAKPQNYERTIRDHLKVALKDPYSLQDFSVSDPVLTSCAIGIYGPFYAWRVPTSYNAKNSYGAYIGLRRYYYWFHGEYMVGMTQDPSNCPEASIWG